MFCIWNKVFSTYSALIDVTTADTSGVAQIAVLRQIIEGQNLQHLDYGTSGAKTITVFVWVKSPTGRHTSYRNIYAISPTNRTISN